MIEATPIPNDHAFADYRQKRIWMKEAKKIVAEFHQLRARVDELEKTIETLRTAQ